MSLWFASCHKTDVAFFLLFLSGIKLTSSLPDAQPQTYTTLSWNPESVSEQESEYLIYTETPIQEYDENGRSQIQDQLQDNLESLLSQVAGDSRRNLAGTINTAQSSIQGPPLANVARSNKVRDAETMNNAEESIHITEVDKSNSAKAVKTAVNNKDKLINVVDVVKNDGKQALSPTEGRKNGRSNIEDISIDDKESELHEESKVPDSASRVNIDAKPVHYTSKSDVIENLRISTKRKPIEFQSKNIVDESIIKSTHEEEVHIDGTDHPCHRECIAGEEPMICYYHFHIEWYQTLSKACYSCPYNETDCFRPDCIPADGISRPITVINRKMPGPSIEVCKNDRIIVDVENGLMVEGTTIHWHGQHQKGTPYMDGTPYVTQCPILPEGTFRYQFNASHAGTHFWHSHAGMQRADGAAGPMIVRKPKSNDKHASLYDYDRSDHTMLITDWVHELSLASFTDHHHSDGDNKPPTLLINGLGRFKIFNETTKPKYMKTARFNVEQGYRYRFRVINAEFLNCPIELTVDNHNLTIISSDGYDMVPVKATSLVTYAGERWDFILDATEEIDNYWIRFRGLMDCDERFTKAKQVAVLHYEGAMEEEPPGDLTWEESHREGLQINALNKGEEEDETISVAELRSVELDDESLKEVPDYQFYIAYDFYVKNNSHFHKSPYYGFYQVPNSGDRVTTPQLNHISFKIPPTPLMLSRPSPDNFCNSSSIPKDCKKEYCECSHVLSVRTGSVVELILIDEGVTFDANHPFHLHGHAFRVIALRRLSNQTTVEEVQAFDQAGLLKRNLKKAPLKDTVTVPDGGYTVVRFKADNPGYWLFHCHLEFHAEVGMALVFKVGEHSEMAPVPPNFPTCGNYMPDNLLELATTDTPTKDDGPFISITHWWPVVYVNSTSASSIQSFTTILSLCVCFWALKFSGL